MSKFQTIFHFIPEWDLLHENCLKVSRLAHAPSGLPCRLSAHHGGQFTHGRLYRWEQQVISSYQAVAPQEWTTCCTSDSSICPPALRIVWTWKRSIFINKQVYTVINNVLWVEEQKSKVYLYFEYSQIQALLTVTESGDENWKKIRLSCCWRTKVPQSNEKKK